MPGDYTDHQRFGELGMSSEEKESKSKFELKGSNTTSQDDSQSLAGSKGTIKTN